jgi:A/G-specific adenine glycosylase
MATKTSSTRAPGKFRKRALPVAPEQQSAHAAPAAQRGPLHAALLGWYAASKRDLPWRRTRDPYAIWLSEVMLQQTRVETVIPYYERFLAAWPTVHALADAPVDDVLAAWSGLGYYRRARMLHAAARSIADAPAFPSTATALREVKGIGPYTAGAVASIAFDEAAPLVDGNVARVLARLFAVEDDVKSARGVAKMWALAGELVPGQEAGAWNQALMELGATVCVPRDPRCLLCPVQASCAARARGVERELPRVKKKAPPKVQRRLAIVATRGESVLVGRRRADLRFGGMWEPPSVDRGDDDDGDAAAIAEWRRVTGAKLRDTERAGEVVHVLSHRRLEITVLRARVEALAPPIAQEAGEYDTFELVEEGALDRRGVATLARKVLEAAIG